MHLTTAWEQLAGPSGSVIDAALKGVRLVPVEIIETAIEELDRAHFVGQGLTADTQPDPVRLHWYGSTRAILTGLRDLRLALRTSKEKT